MKTKKQLPPYFQILSSESEDVADVLLYGVVGQEDWYGENKEEDLTDLAVTMELMRLDRQGYKQINLHINSPGGSVFHGDAIIATMSRMKTPIHTFNDGLAASMAANIWLHGTQRHASVNAKFMFHATSTITFGNVKEMERTAGILRKMDEAAVASMAQATGMEKEDVYAKFYADYEDHWMTCADMIEMGLMPEDDTYDSKDTPPNYEQMTYKQVMQLFSEQPEQAQEKQAGFFARLKDHFTQWQQELLPSPQPIIMNKQELQASLGKEITPEEVAEVLRENGYEVQAKAQDPAPAPADDSDADAMKDILQSMQASMAAMQAEITRLGGQPGAEPAVVAVARDINDDTGLTDEEKKMKAIEAQFAKAVAAKERITITPPQVSRQ